jgi:hypothetical protein
MLFKKTDTENLLDAEIVDALAQLKEIDKTKPEYGALLDRIATLHKLKTEEQSEKISPNNALLVAANVLGILAILGHEHVGPVTSKAIGFIIKPRQ